MGLHNSILLTAYWLLSPTSYGHYFSVDNDHQCDPMYYDNNVTLSREI